MKKIFLFFIFVTVSLHQLAGSNRDNWYVLQKEGFTLSFPGKPDEETRSISSRFGELKITGNIYEVPKKAKDENMLYGIAETEYPAGSLHLDTKAQVDSFLLDAVNGSTGNVGERVGAVKIIEKDNFPGRAFKTRHSKYPYIVNMNIYLVKNHMYALQVISGTGINPGKAIDRFMNSFTIKK